MTKRRVVDGRMVINTGTRVMIRPVDDSDKYQWLLRVIAHAFDMTAEAVDAKITRVMEDYPCF